MAAIELGVPYYIYAPNGSSYACLNNPSDGNFVGYVTDITGLDSAGVRENAQVVVAGDGGYHGPFWRDRRPWTISGIIMPTFPLLARDQAQEKLEGIVGQAMQVDGSLWWTPADGVQKLTKFRNQQPVRVGTGQSNVSKTFQISCVSADYRIYGSTLNSITLNSANSYTATAQNLGNADAPAKYTITGPVSTALYISNLTTGLYVTIDATIGSGVSWVLDMTGTYPTLVDNVGNDQYGTINPLATNWNLAVSGIETVSGGNNSFDVTGGLSGAASVEIQWNNAWL